MRFWNFIKNEANPEDIELRIEGDIVDDDEAWIYEWFGIPVASPNAFREELAQFTGKNIIVWINSYGGSVFAATGMYNALEAHKNSGATVTTIGDAKVMSAAVTLFMAGDKRIATPGCVYMIHNPLTYASGYASDLRKVANILDIVKESIMNAYQKTGLSQNKISAMMDDETYMSAKTAVSQGFATEILNWQNQNSSSGDIVNFSFPRIAIQNAANDSMRKFCDLAKKLGVEETQLTAEPPKESILAEAQKLLMAAVNSILPKNKTINEEEINLEIKNVEDLKKANPELYAQIVSDAKNEAAKAENDRIKALDTLDDLQNPAVHALIEDAKNTGKTADEIKNTVEIVKKHAAPPAATNNGQDFLIAAINGNKNSGVDGVKTDGSSGLTEEQETIAAVNLMANVINQRTGGKK